MYNSNSAEFEYVDDLTAINNIIHDNTFGFLIQTNIGKNHLFMNNTITSTPYDTYIYGNSSTATNFTYNDLSLIRMITGSANILNHAKSLYQVRTDQAGSFADIRYSNNDVFTTTGTANVVTYYPDRSQYVFNQQTQFIITKYPMTALPVSGTATVSVASFNTSLPLGSVLANFTASTTTNNNNITFTVSTLKSNTNYLIKKGIASYTTVQADSTGKITFDNSSWPSNNFTIIETTSTPTPGAISGTISDSSSIPIQGATVSIGANSTTTDLNGSYTLSNISPGTYTLTASSSGYTPQSKSAIVSTAQTTTVNFTLLPPLSADLNTPPDGYVNAQDFAILLSNWNSAAKPKADINQDGIVNSVDFGIMMSQWG